MELVSDPWRILQETCTHAVIISNNLKKQQGEMEDQTSYYYTFKLFQITAKESEILVANYISPHQGYPSLLLIRIFKA